MTWQADGEGASGGDWIRLLYTQTSENTLPRTRVGEGWSPQLNS